MKTDYGHLTYCSNIHSGEAWEAHFEQLQKHFPKVKKKCCTQSAMGIGLRLSAMAAQTLSKKNELLQFKNWLNAQNAYVFTINGFPYGGFHKTIVKDGVHAPDWTTTQRVTYTKRLAGILASLLPEDMEGSISTSPLSYRYWHPTEKAMAGAVAKSTSNLILVVEHLMMLDEKYGKTVFLAIEPEPDGILTDTSSFINWYKNVLLQAGASQLSQKLNLSVSKARAAVRKYIRLCYDICHAAVNYEDHASNVKELQKARIRTGKIQISAALKAVFTSKKENNNAVIKAIQNFMEPTYLHQVISRDARNKQISYADLPDALQQVSIPYNEEWRIHYHVPIFTGKLPPVFSTRGDIVALLDIHKKSPLTNHLEIETYTWEVLPKALKKDIEASIAREIKWVQKQLNP